MNDDRLAWNDKYLDYEIETWWVTRTPMQLLRLETTSTSITKLKLLAKGTSGTRFKAWNDKYLDYEIETWAFR